MCKETNFKRTVFFDRQVDFCIYILRNYHSCQIICCTLHVWRWAGDHPEYGIRVVNWFPDHRVDSWLNALTGFPTGLLLAFITKDVWAYTLCTFYWLYLKLSNILWYKKKHSIIIKHKISLDFHKHEVFFTRTFGKSHIHSNTHTIAYTYTYTIVLSIFVLSLSLSLFLS